MINSFFGECEITFTYAYAIVRPSVCRLYLGNGAR